MYGPSGYKERKYVWPEVIFLSSCSSLVWCIGGEILTSQDGLMKGFP